MRQDVFNSLLAAQKNLGSSVQGEAKRYLERLIKLGKRNGENFHFVSSKLLQKICQV